MALKAVSHEPQSRSIACLVCSVVVSGPGVSRIGSVAFMTVPSRLTCQRGDRARPGCDVDESG